MSRTITETWSISLRFVVMLTQQIFTLRFTRNGNGIKHVIYSSQPPFVKMNKQTENNFKWRREMGEWSQKNRRKMKKKRKPQQQQFQSVKY